MLEPATIALLVGTAVAVVTLIFGVFEFFRQGRQRRAEHFFLLRERLKKDPDFRTLVNLLRHDSKRLARVDFATKAEFVGLFEEVAIMMNSGLIGRDVVHYMFGYYVLLCDGSLHFWKGLDKDGDYWAAFRQLSAKMRESEERFEEGRSRLRI